MPSNQTALEVAIDFERDHYDDVQPEARIEALAVLLNHFAAKAVTAATPEIQRLARIKALEWAIHNSSPHEIGTGAICSQHRKEIKTEIARLKAGKP